MKAIILGAGKPPQKKQVQFLYSKGYAHVVAADGGAESLAALGLHPCALVGDFDSIRPETLRHYSADPGCEVRHLARQTDPDTEKCLEFLAERGCASCVLLAVTGDRLDHTLTSFSLLLRWSSRMHLALIAGQSVAECAAGDARFSATPGALVSLFCFSNKVRIRTEGLVYPLHDETLVFGEREGLSNEASGESVALRIRGGRVIVIRPFSELKRHGFLGQTTDE